MQFNLVFLRPFVKPLSLLIAVTMFIILIGISVFLYQKENILEQSDSNLASIATLKVERIEHWLDGLYSDANVMSEDNYLTGMLTHWLDAGKEDDVNRHHMLHRLKVIQKNKKYVNLALLDLKGNVILSTASDAFGQSDELRKMQAHEVVSSGQIILGDIYLGQQQAPAMDMFAPLFNYDDARQIIGVLYFNINPAQFLFPMLDSWPVERQSAETLLVRKDGDSALFLNEVRRKKDLPLTMRISLNRENIPATHAALGKRGFFRGVDSHDIAVISYLAQIPRMNWGIIAEIDEAEIYAPIYRRAEQLILMGALLFIVAAIATGLSVRRSSRLAEASNKADEELRKSEETLRLLISSVRDYAIIMLDSCGNIASWNKGAEYITGYMAGELLGHDFSALYSLEDIASAQPEKHLKIATSTGRFETEGWVVRKDSTHFWGNTVITAIHDTDKKLIGYAKVTRDISERRQAEKLRPESEALRHASQMKSEFLASMSHELRTPLNAIIGFSEVLKDNIVGDITEQQSKYIGNIFDSGEHLLSLINDVLDLSKIEAGKMELDLETLQPSLLLHESLSMVKEKAMLHNIDLKEEIDSELGSFEGDGRKLKQIIYNLLSNAVKFTSSGGHITLSARRVLRENAFIMTSNTPWNTRLIGMEDEFNTEFKEFLEISVDDTGIGISNVDLDKLFQPFTQIDSSLSRTYEGTGLGLVMVQNLAHLHGGVTAVSSAEGVGSCFKVWLPWREIRVNNECSLMSSLPIMTELLVEHHSAEGYELALVVEDDDNSAELIRLSLEKEGFTVQRVQNAEQALSCLEDVTPALITIDIQLPGMNGWELLTRCKQRPELAQVPFVIISINAEQHKGDSLGASLVMGKPVGPTEMRAAIADLMKNRSVDTEKLSILVVDDDPLAVELIANRLSGMGVVPLVAYSGEQAIEIVHEQKPDAIILDLMMPGMNGFNVVRTLHGNPDTKDIPIIIMTAKSVTREDLATLNGHTFSIIEKSNFNSKTFRTEANRALATGIKKE